jgi:hypothetical protein
VQDRRIRQGARDYRSRIRKNDFFSNKEGLDDDFSDNLLWERDQG